MSSFGAESRHNTGYWTGAAAWHPPASPGRPFLGLGPGAHSRLGQGAGRRAAVNLPLPERWMAAVEARGEGVASEREVGVREALGELIATGLRRREGVEARVWKEVVGGRLDMGEFMVKAARHGVEVVGEGEKERMVVGWEGINVLDSTLPYLINIIDELHLKE